MYISADSVFMSFLIFIYQIQYIILHQPQSILFSYHSHAKAPDDQGLTLLHYVVHLQGKEDPVPPGYGRQTSILVKNVY